MTTTTVASADGANVASGVVDVVGVVGWVGCPPVGCGAEVLLGTNEKSGLPLGAGAGAMVTQAERRSATSGSAPSFPVLNVTPG